MNEKTAFTVEMDGHVAWLTLCRPESRNAMGMAFFKELTEHFRDFDADDQVRAVVIRAEGPSFTAGLDLMEASGLLAGKGVVLIGVVEQTAPSEHQGVDFRIAVFFGGLQVEHIVVKGAGAFVGVDAKIGALFQSRIGWNGLGSENAVAECTGRNDDIWMPEELFSFCHGACRVHLK